MKSFNSVLDKNWSLLNKYFVKMWSVLTTFVILFVGQYATHAGVTVLQAKEPTKLHLNETTKALLSTNGTNQNSPRETVLLTRDKKMENLWRTEDGQLVQLVHVDEDSLLIAKKIDLLNNVPALYEESTSEESIPKVKRSKQNEDSSSSPSRRQKRTFWPFTSLFGYDYYPPPPPIYGPGMFGPMGPMPPYGGFGPGMGMGYLPPPPPYFGLEFAVGL